MLSLVSAGRSNSSPEWERLLNDVFENSSVVRNAVAIVAMGVTVLLLVRIWTVHTDRGLLGKIGWSLVVCVPLVGWVLYGGLVTVPKSHRDYPQHWESDGLG